MLYDGTLRGAVAAQGAESLAWASVVLGQMRKAQISTGCRRVPRRLTDAKFVSATPCKSRDNGS